MTYTEMTYTVSEMTYTVSSGALNSTPTPTRSKIVQRRACEGRIELQWLSTVR